MITYFVFGFIMGGIVGYSISCLLTISSKGIEEENMLDYIDLLEQQNEEYREQLRKRDNI